MGPLNRKLFRDVIHLRGQVAAITLVVACGVTSFVAMRSTYNSLQASQQSYYEAYRFADVFVQLKRAPDSISARVNEIPGVGKAEFRVVADVTLDVPGLDEPAKGRIVSIPDEQVAMLNDLYIKEGRYIEAGQTNEVLGGVLLGIAIGWYFGFKITALYMEFFRFPVLRYAPGPIVIATAILISLSAAAVGALGAVRRTISLPPA